MKSPNLSLKNIAVIVSLIALAVSWRLINHEYGFAYNLELVTTVSMLAALKYGWKAAVAVPLAVMAISDAIIGTSSIIIFSWLSFALIGLGALVLRRYNDKAGKQIMGATVFAIAGSTFFYLVTNFGVWAQGFYPPTLSGLEMSYIMAIPFYKTMLVGNLLFAPAAVASWHLVKYAQRNKVHSTSEVTG